MSWDKDSKEKNKNIYGTFLCKFSKIITYIWIQQFHFGRKQKYLWKLFYTVKKTLKNRAPMKQEIALIRAYLDTI